MPCPCCSDARNWPGTVAAKRYVENCLWCGARYIRLLPTQGRINGRPLTKDEAADRRRKVLAIWMKAGHSEADLRALAKGEALPLEPLSGCKKGGG